MAKDNTYIQKVLLDGISNVEDVSRERVVRSIIILEFRDLLIASPHRKIKSVNSRIISTG